jgi:hypothetical protein
MSNRNLTNEDIIALVEALNKSQEGHACRFASISPEDLREMVKSHKNFNNIVSEGKSTIRKTLVVISVTCAVGVAVAGIVVKCKEAILGKIP